MDYRTLTMSELVAEADAIGVDADRLFGGLSAVQLNWKHDPKQWSVAQCIEHLIHANREMRGPLGDICAGRHRHRLLHRIPGFAGVCGRLMVTSLTPDATRKFRAPAQATPSTSAVGPDIVHRFVAQQQDTIELMRSLELGGMSGIIMTSPFMAVVVYSALDACRIIVAHERRHFAQAQRVMAATGFPQ